MLNYVRTLCNMWCVYAEPYTILAVCWWKFKIPRDFTDYRIYMGSGEKV
jgi:hypothetical protein